MADIKNKNFLSECFDLNTETGDLTWKNRPRIHFNTAHGCNIFNSQKAGKRADAHAAGGYKRVRVNDEIMLSHRVVYLLYYNELPEFVDHINGKRDDNRPSNLRKADRKANSRNTRVYEGSSKYKGVSFNSGKSIWQAFCTDHRLGKLKNGRDRQKYLGQYLNEINAALAYDKHAEIVYGEYAWLNRSNFEEVREAYERRK